MAGPWVRVRTYLPPSPQQPQPPRDAYTRAHAALVLLGKCSKVLRRVPYIRAAESAATVRNARRRAPLAIVFNNTYKDIETILEIFRANGTRFEFECYDTSHLYNLHHFLERRQLRVAVTSLCLPTRHSAEI
jgi:uncharacterized protein (DUF849 family)